MQSSIRGVSRVADNDKSLLISFDRPPTDDELRMVHEILQSNEYAWKNVHILERARQEQDKEFERLKHERDCLASAIHSAASKVGIINSDTIVSGPELLMLCEDLCK